MINHVEHVEHAEELKALASEVGQIAYGVHEYFGTGLPLAPEHYAQIINYLKIMDKPVGLLINFGSRKFERRTVYQ